MSALRSDEALVSVVIPCYNVAPYLAAAVTSVLEQTHSRWECIIVNDGSTDDSLRVARDLERSDGRIRVIDQANRGLSGARNRGLLEARGHFIQFLDGDDLLEPAKLAVHAGIFHERPEVDIVYGDSWAIREARPGVRLPMPRCDMVVSNPLEQFGERWEKGLSIPIHAVLFRRTCFERWGMFDERLPNHEDWDLYLRFSARGARYCFVPGRLAIYRVRANSMTRRLEAMHHGKCLVLSKHLANSAMPFGVRWNFAVQFLEERIEVFLDLTRQRKWRAGLRYVRDPGLGSPWSYACVAALVCLATVRGCLAGCRRLWKSVTHLGRTQRLTESRGQRNGE